MVARGRRVHDQLMARTRPRTSTEYLKINHPEDSFKRLFRQPRGDPCVCACVRASAHDTLLNFYKRFRFFQNRTLPESERWPETSENVVLCCHGQESDFRRFSKILSQPIQHFISEISANVLRMLGCSSECLLDICMGSSKTRSQQGAKRCVTSHDLVSRTLEPF